MNAEEIQAIFFAECEESLAAAEQGLAACKEGTQDADTVNAVFRGVHSIKGGAGAFGYIALQGFTHTFETLLSDVRDGTVPITEPLVDLLLRALDTLSDHVAAARGLGETPDDVALQAELTAAMAANAGAMQAAMQPLPRPSRPPPRPNRPAAAAMTTTWASISIRCSIPSPGRWHPPMRTGPEMGPRTATARRKAAPGWSGSAPMPGPCATAANRC
jgi:two-component system chemotaxis sensor kinase CheA